MKSQIKVKLWPGFNNTNYRYYIHFILNKNTGFNKGCVSIPQSTYSDSVLLGV